MSYPELPHSPLPRTPFVVRTIAGGDQQRRAIRRSRRDRHDRGLRGPLLPPYLPAWRTRAERFDEAVCRCAARIATRVAGADLIEYAVEEVPPSDPAPWERGIVLGRGFSAEPRAGLPARIVLYRQPITSRTCNDEELAELIERVVIEQTALMLGRRPEEIDPNF